jgi:hypothetical protein
MFIHHTRGGEETKDCVERALLPAAFDLDFDLAFDLDRTPISRGCPSFASFAKGGNHERPQCLPLTLTLPVWNGHSCPLPLTLVLTLISTLPLTLPVWNGHACPLSYDVGSNFDLDVALALDPANRPNRPHNRGRAALQRRVKRQNKSGL